MFHQKIITDVLQKILLRYNNKYIMNSIVNICRKVNRCQMHTYFKRYAQPTCIHLINCTASMFTLPLLSIF